MTVLVQTEHLVVGAGASGMAFIDALIGESDPGVVMVDQRHRPGSRWNDDYPFVRLHQPSATYESSPGRSARTGSTTRAECRVLRAR